MAFDLGDSSVLLNSLRPRLNQLVVCLSHSWGGLEQVAANDAVDVGALGIKVHVMVLEGSPIHENLAHRKEVSLVPLNFRPRNYFDLRMRTELERWFSQGVNLIHSHQTSVLGSIVPWLWGHPEVAMLCTRHIMSNHNKKNFFHRAIYRRLDALMVISRSVKLNVMDTHPIRERFVKVVNLGLDFDRFDPEKVDSVGERAKWHADDETVVIGLVGRIDPAKGQATFIKAAAGLLKSLRAGEKLKFVIVGEETLGSSGTYLEELKRMLKQFRMEEHFVFVGYQENIPEIMRAFDIFVMPSRQEAFGLVAIEAMSMECPIIISSGGSAEEIVGERADFGLTIRPDDAFDLQRQIRFMLDNPMKRIQMGQKAREHVRRNYDRRARLQRTLEIYEAALRRRGN
ncbi:glycosyltransferase family 4 protein [Bdellovibrionota bacterium FG-1]